MAVQRRNTRQRKLVLDAVRQSYNHPTADEIYNVVRAQDDKISRVIDVPLPFDAQLDAKASEQIGWHVTSHYTIFEGLCPDCR